MILKSRGFTLIELLVVIAIIGVLSSIVLVSLQGARVKARDATRQSDLHTMQTALELYASDHNGKYPITSSWTCQDCTSSYGNPSFFTTTFVTPGYMSSWPNDPTPISKRGSTSYGYLYTSNGTGYELLIYQTVETECTPKSLMRGGGSKNSYVNCSDASYSSDCQGNPGYTTTC